MSFAEIKDLIDQFQSSDIRELDLTIDGVSLYLNKNDMSIRHLSGEKPTVTVGTTPSVQTAVPEVEPETPTVTKPEAKVTEVAQEIEGSTVDSPIVGIVYTSSEPGAAAFVSVGDKVTKGDTLCIIEAMKIMNEVTSDKTGIITEILIENEDVVEFGKPLFRIA